MTDNLTDIISTVFWQKMDSVHTFFPGEITEVKSNGLVNVKPSYKVYFPSETTDEELPVIPDVLLMHTRSDSAIIRVPKETLKGSRVGVLISETCLEDWREKKGATVLPTDGRRYNINDAVALLGLYPETLPWLTEQKPNTLEIQVKGNQKIGIGQNAEGYEFLSLVYNLITNMLAGVNTGTGLFNNAAQITQIQTALARMTNISTIPV